MSQQTSFKPDLYLDSRVYIVLPHLYIVVGRKEDEHRAQVQPVNNLCLAMIHIRDVP